MLMDNGATSKERRRFKRMRINLAVTYRIDKPLSVRMTVGNREIRATMLDISEGGISALTNYNVPPLSVVFIKFTLFRVEDEDVSFYGPMEITGEVLYSSFLGGNEYRVGVHFKHIKQEDKAAIVNFIKSTHLP
jgi:c-di-GMP-binding flagellar brake protein YcgR